MKYIIIVIFALLNINSAFSKNQYSDFLRCDTLYSSDDSLVIGPEYPFSTDSMIRFNERNAKPAPIIAGMVPAKARVFMTFNVDKQGNVFAPSIMKVGRIYYDHERDESHQKYDKDWKERIDSDYCEKEAIRILSLIKFIPAKRNNINVCFEQMGAVIHVYYAAAGYD